MESVERAAILHQLAFSNTSQIVPRLVDATVGLGVGDAFVEKPSIQLLIRSEA